MRSTFRVLLPVLAVLVAGATFLQNEVRLESFVISNSDGDVTVRWEAQVEQNVKEYVLKRHTPYSNGTFEVIERITAHGVGKPYEYRDQDIYKASSEEVQYRLVAVYQDGTDYVIDTESLNYEPTAVRRTWGSIKAMFQ